MVNEVIEYSLWYTIPDFLFRKQETVPNINMLCKIMPLKCTYKLINLSITIYIKICRTLEDQGKNRSSAPIVCRTRRLNRAALWMRPENRMPRVTADMAR
jgi:hypothetical protein